MKRLIYILLFACASFTASAEAVDSDTALGIAKQFFGGNNLSLVWSGERTKSDMEAPSYYSFNNPDGGWVIIAGDDCCEPVLAYSMTGSFDAGKLPSNFVGWMNGVSRNVKAVRKAGLRPADVTKAGWKSVGRTKASSETLIETAQWGQESFYNAYCPSGCPTGCVATAMAIVMRQNAYDVVGKGKIPAYKTTTDSKSVAAIDIDGYTYNWDNMPLDCSSLSSTTKKNAIARLMQHCGAMVEMDYTSSGSGAYSCDIVPAMVEYFGYSASAYEVYRNGFSNNEWMNVIKKEIDSGRALIYGGGDSSTEDGHQFVLDGYNSDNMVHINWGWEGELNGWYAVSYLGDKLTGGVNDVFSYFDSAVIGLTFDPEGTDKSNVDLSLEPDADNEYVGVSLVSGKIAKGSTFTIKIGCLCNYDAYNAYDGSVKVGLFSIDGTLKEYVGDEFDAYIAGTDFAGNPGYITKSSYSCKITSDLALGDYLTPVYKLSDGTWRPVASYRSDEFTSDEYHTVGKLGVIDMAMLIVPSNPKAGEVIYFEMTGSHKCPSSIKWYWDGVQNTKRFVAPTSGKHTLKAQITYVDDSTETLQKVLNVQ